MEKKQKKNSLKNIVDSHPLTVIISTIILTVGVTSAVFIFERNNLIMYYNLIIENYKLENQRLEKIIDQQAKIKNLDSIANSLRDVLGAQTKINELKHLNNNSQNLLKNKFSNKNWISQIKKALEIGDKLLKSDPADNKTFNSFSSWRNESISLLNQIDIELKTNYENNFKTLTKLEMAQYPQLKTKINDGLSIIRTVKLYYY